MGSNPAAGTVERNDTDYKLIAFYILFWVVMFGILAIIWMTTGS